MSFPTFLDKAAIVSLTLCAAFVLQLGFWLTSPYNVMRINDLKIVDSQVEVGEYLEYSLDYCKDKKYDALRAQVEISFRDGVVYNLPIETGWLAPGCTTTLVALAVPVIPEGKYHLEVLLTYFVNPIRKIEIHAVSNVFKVSNQRRMEEMLKRQLPEVIPKVIPQIPQLR